MEIKEIDIKFIDASSWQELSWYSSGGTRAKKILQDADGNHFYFKCSEKKSAKDGKPEKHYKYEFWNEIIAYQLGKMLGLDILRYDVAVFENEIGCLSPKMTITFEEQLLEFGRFMTAMNPNFLPENNKTRNEYTFQLLAETLDNFKLSNYLPFIFQTLLFDTIIGNTDRHQENWAFIGKNSFITAVMSGVVAVANADEPQKRNWLARRITKYIYDKEKKDYNEVGKQIILQNINISKTAPIYDSGSSLARELTNEKVDHLLQNEDELNRYFQNGKSELHWENRKLTHYQLISELLGSSYMGEVQTASSFLQNWQPALVNDIINAIDMQVPEKWSDYCIPENRKKLILKLLTLRYNKLSQILSERV